VAYGPSFAIPYLFDDHSTIEQNAYLAHADTWEWLTRVPENSTLIGRIVLSWSFGLNALLFGHDPTVYHFLNLLIHLANVLLVALLVRRGLAYTNLAEPLRDWAAVAAALVWGVHPLNVNAVGYLIQRGESLSALWLLLTLYAWIRAQERKPNTGWYAVACAGPLLCAATKEQGWIVPFVPLLWAWIFLERGPREEVRRHPALYASGVASWLLLAGLTFTSGRIAHVGAEPTVDTWSYFITQPGVLTHYVRLFFVPIGQSFDYDWPVSTLPGAAPFVLLWVALFGATAFAVWKRAAAGFPAALAFLSLATSSSFLPLPDLAFEHRFYLAGACVAAICAGLFAHLFPRAAAARSALVGCAAVALAVLTWQRCTLFHDEFAVWSEAVERNPTQRRALSNVGGMLLARHQPRAALDMFRRIEAVGIPSRMQTRVNLHIGNALFDLGRYDESRAYYEKTLTTLNGDPGPIYQNIGHTYLEQDDYPNARKAFERGLTTTTQLASLHFDLAYACAELSDTECMIGAYLRGIALGGRPQSALSELVAIYRPDLVKGSPSR
jgi:tetratricopeptide (TPR) repeat protein